jgi:hypothetical protein
MCRRQLHCLAPTGLWACTALTGCCGTAALLTQQRGVEPAGNIRERPQQHTGMTQSKHFFGWASDYTAVEEGKQQKNPNSHKTFLVQSQDVQWHKLQNTQLMSCRHTVRWTLL